MDTKKILSDLRAEFERINQAIAALESLSDGGVRAEAVYKAAADVAPKPRRMSAAGRRRISEAAKARWAARRSKTATPATTKPSGGRKMSAAARKRISAMMKKRWAERRKKAAKTA